jgi:hypothetical protein
MSPVTSVGDLAGLLLLLAAAILTAAARRTARRPAARPDETRPAGTHDQPSDPTGPAQPSTTGIRTAAAASSGLAVRPLVEDRVAGPAALQLEEAVSPGDQQYAIPQPRSVLAVRNR